MAQIDKYEVLEEIGRGGMGAVYKAVHPQFKKFVAIKEIRADLANNPTVVRRFEQEIEVLAQVPPHPSIVTVRDALVWQGNLYIVMDYIEGQDLSCQIRSGPLAANRAEILLERVLSGLEAIHNRGIVHRDLKASNILIDTNGNAYITDFGIAEFTNKQSNSVVMATPRYSAPELIDPRLRGDGTDQQLDIYAAGLLSYEMMLGEMQFRKAFPQVYNDLQGSESEKWLRWHLRLNLPATPLHDLNKEIPEDLGTVIARMMAKEVKLRYRTVKDIRRDLAEMRRQREYRARLQETTFDQTIPIEIPLGAITNVIGPDTAALYETQTLDPDLSQLSESTMPSFPPRRQEAVEVVTAENPANVTKRMQPVESVAPPSAVEPPSAAVESVPAPGGRSRLLYAAAGVLLLLVALAAYLLLSPKSVTLVVRGAPADSAVFVDNQRYGSTAADGTLRVESLTPGIRSIRVTRDGYKDFSTTVEAKSGVEQVVFANLEKEVTASVGASSVEIDYTGIMVLIPAGQFLMGDDRQKTSESPAHRVTLPAFYIDKYEVTNAQYKQFCDATGRPTPTNTQFNKEYFTKFPDKPVIGVSWQDASDYAAWAGKRLPTEEEWEKAASWDPAAQKKRQFPWGDEPDMSRANIGKTPQEMTEVGEMSTGASAYGVMDMAGNAAEWVESYYQPYTGNQTNDPDFGVKHRVIRGGDVLAKMDDVRTTRRQHGAPDLAARYDAAKGEDFNTAIGFRCAISAADPRVEQATKIRR